MTQGEGTSLLVRAYDVTRNEVFLEAARRALALMLLPVDRGGVARDVPEGLVLEEVASQRENAVLNGWIFSLFGLHDFLLVRPDDAVAVALDRTLAALCRWLPRYCGPYWSNYDTQGTLASPFYHRLHIAQLSALEMTFPERAVHFANARARFERQAASRGQSLRALITKAVQKLRQPPPGILR
ncbi:D-glucuronyl C5-epimerase family protein [Anaeromyxobacter soli]|uniref:D-glucuronyl C5-epimerase family protein n=1 Tax=Anaeromyxobacter soli TaxID=2922725 RepID=UPI001FB01650|nr:D-glucuronyl C5-epimerase family protein [Anaeromyxobacter sp. SG29]